MLICHTVGKNHAIHRNQGADRDIDTARKHDTGHAGSHTDQTGIGNEQIQKSLKMSKSFSCVNHASDGVHADKQ